MSLPQAATSTCLLLTFIMIILGGVALEGGAAFIGKEFATLGWVKQVETLKKTSFVWFPKCELQKLWSWSRTKHY